MLVHFRHIPAGGDGREAEGFSILYVKDFIKHPKESGYRSYHMHISVPVQTSRGIIPTKVELQIRTIAMDFWASLEHKIYYKFEGDAPDYISRDLRSCATIVANLDEKMLSLNEAIMELEAEERKQAEAAAEAAAAEAKKLMESEDP